jgi:hypothetical protein
MVSKAEVSLYASASLPTLDSKTRCPGRTDGTFSAGCPVPYVLCKGRATYYAGLAHLYVFCKGGHDELAVMDGNTSTQAA